MVRTIAVDPHSCATRCTIRAAPARPTPSPPTRVELRAPADRRNSALRWIQSGTNRFGRLRRHFRLWSLCKYGPAPIHMFLFSCSCSSQSAWRQPRSARNATGGPPRRKARSRRAVGKFRVDSFIATSRSVSLGLCAITRELGLRLTVENSVWVEAGCQYVLLDFRLVSSCLKSRYRQKSKYIAI